MNASAAKQLIRNKGFAYANGTGAMKGMLALIRPDDQRLQFITGTVLGWLEMFNDVVIPSDSYSGYYAGDQVQIFNPAGEYSYWGQFGRVLRVVTDKKLGKMAVVEVPFGDLKAELTLRVIDISVIGREGVVNLQGMTQEERDEVIMQMQGITEQRRSPVEDAPVCECNDDNCKIDLEPDEWSYLNRKRGDADVDTIILSKACLTHTGGIEVAETTDNLMLVQLQ